ncbi:hypothetical protein DPMN_082318 [Dreissena polymorpha]|uniref:Uncharacterized protein n=1 Tax=Dreissena polymorpha TaxID=45954 RepID=A0A9D3YAJ2_DREPO|nr:hypothetical protein DPMN_082318 [Dreissena polymorpha]
MLDAGEDSIYEVSEANQEKEKEAKPRQAGSAFQLDILFGIRIQCCMLIFECRAGSAFQADIQFDIGYTVVHFFFECRAGSAFQLDIQFDIRI